MEGNFGILSFHSNLWNFPYEIAFFRYTPRLITFNSHPNTVWAWFGILSKLLEFWPFMGVVVCSLLTCLPPPHFLDASYFPDYSSYWSTHLLCERFDGSIHFSYSGWITNVAVEGTGAYPPKENSDHHFHPLATVTRNYSLETVAATESPQNHCFNKARPFIFWLEKGRPVDTGGGQGGNAPQ